MFAGLISVLGHWIQRRHDTELHIKISRGQTILIAIALVVVGYWAFSSGGNRARSTASEDADEAAKRKYVISLFNERLAGPVNKDGQVHIYFSSSRDGKSLLANCDTSSTCLAAYYIIDHNDANANKVKYAAELAGFSAISFHSLDGASLMAHDSIDLEATPVPAELR
jgi:hypothetical protein